MMRLLLVLLLVLLLLLILLLRLLRLRLRLRLLLHELERTTRLSSLLPPPLFLPAPLGCTLYSPMYANTRNI